MWNLKERILLASVAIGVTLLVILACVLRIAFFIGLVYLVLLMFGVVQWNF